MYTRRIIIDNLRSIKNLEWSLPRGTFSGMPRLHAGMGEAPVFQAMFRADPWFAAFLRL